VVIIVADPVSRPDITEHAAALNVALDTWAQRDDSRPQPEVRTAANTAMDTIDVLLRDIYELRDRLTGEIKQSDDASMARAEALLADVRERRAAGTWPL
jgi:hypothetical protein